MSHGQAYRFVFIRSVSFVEHVQIFLGICRFEREDPERVCWIRESAKWNVVQGPNTFRRK